MMTWRPSVGDLVRVAYGDHLVVAFVADVWGSGTRRELFLIVKNWGQPQFRERYRLGELEQVGLRINGYRKKGNADPGT
jgi:hypothetical protein